MGRFKKPVPVLLAILLLSGIILFVNLFLPRTAATSVLPIIALAGILVAIFLLTQSGEAALPTDPTSNNIDIDQQKHLTHLIDSFPVGITVKDPGNDFRYLICNRAAAEIFGKEPAEIIGHSDLELFSSETAREQHKIDFMITSSGSVSIASKGLLNFGYGGIWLKTTRILVQKAFGKPCSLVQILEDVSDNVKLESQLQHSQRMDEIGKLAGGVAHEFNNLLQVILGYCEFIKEDNKENERIINNIEQIEKAGTNAMQLTRQLLTYSRKTDMKKEAVDLSQVVAGALKMITRIIGDGIEIDFKPSNAPIAVLADTTQIGQILVNLCVNARDALGGKGKIVIEANQVVEVPRAINAGIRKNVQQIFGHLRVIDNGPGIPEKLRDQLFKPFFTTKEVGKGTGLGLAIIYAIIKQHEGYIFYDDNYTDGCAFDVYLPLAEITELKAAAVPNLEDAALQTSGLLVLIAEDEPAVREMNIKLLRKNGFRTLSATNGEEAVELFSQHAHEVSALVFDVMMPKMTGKAAYEVIRKIKPGLPTIFCTGYSGRELESEFAGQHNIIILDKPFKTRQLIDSLRTILTRTAE